MLFNMLSVSEKARGRILSMTDIRSLFELRKVSKFTKDFVDLSLLSLRETKIHFTAKRMIISPKIELTIVFEDFESRYLWRTCLKYVPTKLALSCFSFKYSDATNITNPLTTTMKIDETRDFLECLKPLIGKTQILTLALPNCSQEIFRFFSAFTDQKSINSIEFAFKTFENVPHDDYIDLIKQCAPNIVDLQMQFVNVELFAWVRQLAKYVERITIFVAFVDQRFQTVELIRSFMDATKNSKCQQLTIRIFQNDNVKLADMEKLIQALHRTDVKVLVDVRQGDPIHAHFGVCKIEPGANYASFGNLTIQHL